MIWILVACAGGPGDLGLPEPDPVVFEQAVQPVLGVSCANPSCHGQPGRPLSIYAPGRWRMEPDAAFRDEPLTDEELDHNLLSAAAFLVDVDRALDSELVGKPLAPEHGGMEHGGGVQWADPGEPGFVVVRDWAAAAIGEVAP